MFAILDVSEHHKKTAQQTHQYGIHQDSPGPYLPALILQVAKQGCSQYNKISAGINKHIFRFGVMWQSNLQTHHVQQSKIKRVRLLFSNTFQIKLNRRFFNFLFVVAGADFKSLLQRGHQNQHWNCVQPSRPDIRDCCMQQGPFRSL